jgi:hypothetical protein
LERTGIGDHPGVLRQAQLPSRQLRAHRGGPDAFAAAPLEPQTYVQVMVSLDDSATLHCETFPEIDLLSLPQLTNLGDSRETHNKLSWRNGSPSSGWQIVGTLWHEGVMH